MSHRVTFEVGTSKTDFSLKTRLKLARTISARVKFFVQTQNLPTYGHPWDISIESRDKAEN